MKFSLIASVATILLASSVKARVSFTPGLTWNYPLNENHLDIKHEKAQVIVVDLHGTSKETIQKYHDAGKKVICYFSAGSYEGFRPDKEAMKKVSGLISYDDKVHHWDEYYLDVRKSGVKPIMKERMKLAKENHCDGMEADNLDVCNNVKHIHLSADDCVEYARWLAQTAHDIDISIGLKNSRYMYERVAKYFDFAINESCFTHGEYCHQYKKLFLDDGKAVFSINYNTYLKKKGGFSALCKHVNGLPISMIVKESQELVQKSYVIDSEICGSNFDNGVKNIKTATTTTATATSTATTTATGAAGAAGATGATGATGAAAGAAGAAGAKNGAAGAKNGKDDHPVVNQIVDEKDGGSGGGVVAGVAVTVPVVGAAAAFIFAKKNPKQYENLKRSLSHKATTVKQGATELSRRATQKASDLSRRISKKNQKTIDPTNDAVKNNTTTQGTENTSSTESYRYTFTQQMEDLKFDGKLNIYQ